MLCLNCGREVEFNGNVCPWCGAQKVQSQLTHIYAYFWGILGAGLGAFIGYQMDPEFGWFVGGGIGMVGGIVIGLAKGSSALKQAVKCPLCGTDLEVDRAKGPNYNCGKCGGLFHLQ
jgi:DNA-directed RNA polymerase subunit RPC12/RpoP